jgi:2-polyprenyl-3-methyl-5-hydroxy-6-metoxy-1,4-benzoquinol methylase
MDNLSALHKQSLLCPSSTIIPVIEILQVPVHCNLLWPTKEGALEAPRGDIRLGFLPDCGHIFNLDFDPTLMEYTQEYENSLHFSPRFQQYAMSLATRLIERYDLRHKDLIEIGSGKGDFLKMMCQLGDNRGVGFDPSYVPDEIDSDLPISFVQQFYSERYTDQKADFIGCRHVLEHIEQPSDFLAMIRRVIGDRTDTVVFFEVPNALFTVRQLGVWDIIYEHCSYFSPYSLAHAFQQNDFKVLDVRETFDGQFLTIEALPGATPSQHSSSLETELLRMKQDVEEFTQNYRRKVTLWQRRLQQMSQAGQRVVVWGAGSKGVTFMNILKTDGIVDYVVDINPRKEGMYVAGTGQTIVPPEFLISYQPEIVVLMNANYRQEIGQHLERLGVAAKIMIA